MRSFSIGKKHLIIIAAVLGVILMVAGTFFSGKKNHASKSDDGDEVEYYSEKLEEKIEKLICGAYGVGDAEVVVTLEGTGEYVYARNEEMSGDDLVFDYVIVKDGDGEDAIAVTRLYPKVRGVAIVCGGGESDEVKRRVTELVACALGISSNRIAVSG